MSSDKVVDLNQWKKNNITSKNLSKPSSNAKSDQDYLDDIEASMTDLEYGGKVEVNVPFTQEFADKHHFIFKSFALVPKDNDLTDDEWQDIIEPSTLDTLLDISRDITDLCHVEKVEKYAETFDFLLAALAATIYEELDAVEDIKVLDKVHNMVKKFLRGAV